MKVLLLKRRLGRMGYDATIITLGGCGVGRISQEEADEAVELALSHGVNMIDTAPSYGEAELRLAPWVQKMRNAFFIAEKTRERTREGAWRELHGSLGRMGIEGFDLYQLHGIGTREELDQALGVGGAIEALEEARDTGLIRYLGVTGHEDMRILREALERFDFDSVLLTVSLCSMAGLQPQNDFRPVLKEAAERGVSVTAIKAISRGRWKGERRYGTWYHPSDDLRDIELGVRYTLSQEAVVTYSLPCDVRLWEMVLETAEKFTVMGEEEQIEAVNYAKKAGFSPLFPSYL
ncbi:MAG: aldo/keto reductase [Candidatus Bathyarchaeota archaeon]|nr:MAG: aldo/keto reductase [Candidatus Bathyarchaeota archaeon]